MRARAQHLCAYTQRVFETLEYFGVARRQFTTKYKHGHQNANVPFRAMLSKKNTSKSIPNNGQNSLVFRKKKKSQSLPLATRLNYLYKRRRNNRIVRAEIVVERKTELNFIRKYEN